MLSGSVVKRFEVSGLGEVRVRYLKMSDASDRVDLINSLVEEGADILQESKVELDEEIEVITDYLKEVEKNKSIHLAIENQGKVKGFCNVKKDRGAMSHTGELGIVLNKDVRGKGVGKKALEVLQNEAKEKLGIEILTLCVYETNKRAQRFYKKAGFKEIGEIRNGAYHNGQYKNIILMQKHLEKQN